MPSLSLSKWNWCPDWWGRECAQISQCVAEEREGPTPARHADRSWEIRRSRKVTGEEGTGVTYEKYLREHAERVSAG